MELSKAADGPRPRPLRHLLRALPRHRRGRRVAGRGQHGAEAPSLARQRRGPRLPSGKIFQIVSDGYGFMRSYSDNLSVDDRWAVIGYLRALQLRSGVSLEGLPLALRDRAKAALR